MNDDGTVQFCEYSQGGRKRLPKFKFSAKFPIVLQVILQIQKKKLKMTAIAYYVKNYFNRKSVEVQPCTPLEIMLNQGRWEYHLP